ncbi:hypothetical protein AMECASPLE_003341 [Ameca splendens]|uniref:Uncharacterized protein n=1 Tax=Ameca splendens TaxID=208324 RepID=A0ABV1A4V0_9TELE
MFFFLFRCKLMMCEEKTAGRTNDQGFLVTLYKLDFLIHGNNTGLFPWKLDNVQQSEPVQLTPCGPVQQTGVSVVQSTESCRLDYCSSLCFGLDRSSDHRLQSVQHPAAGW